MEAKKEKEKEKKQGDNKVQTSNDIQKEVEQELIGNISDFKDELERLMQEYVMTPAEEIYKKKIEEQKQLEFL